MTLKAQGSLKAQPLKAHDPLSNQSFKKTPKQVEAIDIHSTPDVMHSCLAGGSRSGKSFIIIRTMVLRCLKAPKSRHLICRLRFSHVKTSIGMDTLPTVIEKCFPRIGFAFNKTDWYVTFDNGSQIWLTGTDDNDRVDKILGTEYSSIFFNEASQFTNYDTIGVIMTRLAQNSGLDLKAYYDCNPPTKKHWLYSVFVKGLIPKTKEPIPEWEKKYAFLSMNPVDNLENLPDSYIDTLKGLPKKQRERFLLGQFGDDTEGALWSVEMIDAAHSMELTGTKRRTVIAADPAVTNNADSDEWGIMVGSMYSDNTSSVDFDYSGQMSTDSAAQVLIDAYKVYDADAIVVEVNQGGDLVENVLRLKGFQGKIINVRASKGKFARAEPISALYEQNKVKHASSGLEDLESEMMEWIPHESKMSPNRIDALVWLMFELYHLGEKPVIPVYKADYDRTKHIAPTELVCISSRPIVIGWSFGMLPAVCICQRMQSGQIRVLEEITALESGLRRFALHTVRPILEKRYRSNRFVSVGTPTGIEGGKSSVNDRASFDTLWDCGIPTEPSFDYGFESLTDNVRRFMQLVNGKQGMMMIDPRCQDLLDALAHGYFYNEYSKPNHIPVIEAHQYAMLEAAQGEQEVNLPIIEHKVILDEAIGY